LNANTALYAVAHGGELRKCDTAITLGGRQEVKSLQEVVIDIKPLTGSSKDFTLKVLDSDDDIVFGMDVLHELKLLVLSPNKEWVDFEAEGDGISCGRIHLKNLQISLPNSSTELDIRIPTLEMDILDLAEEFSDIFSENISDTSETLPKFKIQLEQNQQNPIHEPPRRLPIHLVDKANMQVEDWLQQGIIQPSNSSWSAPIVMVKKKTGDYRLCVDYRKLNLATKPLPFPMQIPASIFERLHGNKYFAKLDLANGFLQIPMDKESIPLTAFSTPDGLYEFTRLPFGLKNSPTFFQKVMSDILKPLLHKGVELYIDDNIIYGRTADEFLNRLRKVFQLLQSNGLRLKVSKCVYAATSLDFLGHTISSNGVALSKDRIAAIRDLPQPKSIKGLRSFLGSLNYVRDYIENYASKAKPLFDLLRKGRHFIWKDIHQNAFEDLKNSAIKAPLLSFVQDGPLYLQTDASDIGIGAVLYQIENNKKIVISYLSKTFDDTQRNWPICEKEAFGIYHSVTKLSHFLLGRQFIIMTDHANLLFMQSATSPKIQRWRLRMGEYNYTVQHIKGSDNVVADSLSRLRIMQTTDTDTSNQQLTVDQKLEILRQVHGSSNGHHGIPKTFEFLKQQGYNWEHMQDDCKEFVRTCYVCQKYKNQSAENILSGSLTTTMETEPFSALSVDLLGPFPKDQYQNVFVLVAMDSFSRWTELRPLHDKTAESVATQLLDIICRHKIPKNLRSDNGGEFTASLIQHLCSLMGVEQILTIPYRPQGNGLVERRNAEILKHLRTLMIDLGKFGQWSRLLPLVQRVVNLTPHVALGVSPAKLLFGIHAPDSPNWDNWNTNQYQALCSAEYLQQLTKMQQSLLENAQRHQNMQLQQYFKSSTEDIVTLQPGDYVLKTYPERPPSKLSPKYQGPFVVVDKMGTNTYSIQHCFTGRTIQADISDLRQFYLNDWDTTPIETVASWDFAHQEYVVNKIVTHRFTKGRKLQGLRFLINWKDFSDEFDEWKPYEEIKDLTCLDTYLLDHKDLDRFLSDDQRENTLGKGGVRTRPRGRPSRQSGRVAGSKNRPARRGTNSPK